MKKILSLFLSAVMLLSITAGIDFSAYAANYNSDYRRWSQGKSSYSWMKGYGCWVVAESKLIYETGVNKNSSFNPDVYYKWVTNKGYVTNAGNVYPDNPVRYAKALGNTKLSYSGVSTSDLTNKVINNAKSGYYSIIKVKTSVGNEHYVMANNAKTKSTGKVYIYDSWNSVNEPPAIFAWSDIKSKVNATYTMKAVYTFKYSGTTSITKPSVSVKAVSDVTSTSAQINFTANNPSQVTIKTVGVQVRVKGASSWTTKTEAMNSSYTNAKSVPMWWTVGSGKEMNMRLYAGVTYEYRAYVVYNGTNYYSSVSTFKTSGTHTHSYGSGTVMVSATCTASGTRKYTCSICYATKMETIPIRGHSFNSWEITKNASCTENGVKTYYCSRCTATKKENIPAAGHQFNGGYCAVCGAVDPDYSVILPDIPSTPTVMQDVSTSADTTAQSQTVSVSKKVNKPKKPNWKSLKSGKRQFKAVWKKVTGTSGYQIQYSTSSKFTKKTTKAVIIKKNKTTTKTIKKLKSNKKYHVRIRSFKKVNGKMIYSSWSKVKTVKTK